MKYQNTMSNYIKIPANDLSPGDAFHPGEFLAEEMEARGMKQVELAKALGLSKSEVSLILNGKRGISVSIALKLELLWGTHALIWMRLQVRYEVERIRIKYLKELKTSPLSSARKSALKKQLVRA
jgi:addiction module HigA family antidote